MKRFTLLFVAAALTGVSCERHEFEGPNGTKQLHEAHASHGEAANPAEKTAP
jgi:hypothetical protein